MDTNAQVALSGYYDLAAFLANPGALGKSEIGLVVNRLLVYLDGVVLPTNNEVVVSLRTFRREIAPIEKTNLQVLKAIAIQLGPQGRALPGVSRTVETKEGF